LSVQISVWSQSLVSATDWAKKWSHPVCTSSFNCCHYLLVIELLWHSGKCCLTQTDKLLQRKHLQTNTQTQMFTQTTSSH